MIFGFAAAALGGFLLTAVPNWTGAKSARHVFIITASGVWLAGRLAIWFSGALAPWLVAAVDLAFLPILAAKIAIQLAKRPKPQNVMFLLFLALIWSGSLIVHLEWMGITADTAERGLRVGLIGLTSMISILGGRVTPAFTRNALLREGRPDRLPVEHRRRDAAGIILAIATAVAVLIGLPDAVGAVLAILAGLAAAARLSGWRGLALPGQPIVWVLHLGYGMLALGFVLWGLAQLGLGDEMAALHVLGIGAVGGMTLAVMSRATLGHSGRALVAPGPVALAYALIPVAVVLRWAGSTFPGSFYLPGVLGSGLAWCLAFTLYVVALWPIFVGPRSNGKEAAA